MSIGDGFYTALALALHILITCCLFRVWWCDEITLCLTLESFLNGFYSYVAQAWIIKWVTYCLMHKGIIGICVYCVVELLIFLHVTKCVSRGLYLICLMVVCPKVPCFAWHIKYFNSECANGLWTKWHLFIVFAYIFTNFLSF